MATGFSNSTLRLVSIQGIYDQSEVSPDTACEALCVFASEDGTRVELPVTDWEFAALAHSGKQFVLSGELLLVDALPPAPPGQADTVLAVTDFMRQFTDDERLSISSIPQAVALTLKLLSYQTIDVASQPVIDGINLLMGAGIITPDRAAFLLALKYPLPA